jgi:hypothetical protein
MPNKRSLTPSNEISAEPLTSSVTPLSQGVSHAFACDRPRPGHCAWNELQTPDQAAAWKFYGELFGWNQEGEMDMGAMGKYQFIQHGTMLGAVMLVLAGAVLVKPVMNIVDTWPPLYTESMTFWAHNWRMQHVDFMLASMLEQYHKVVDVARVAQERYFRHVTGRWAAERFADRFVALVSE